METITYEEFRNRLRAQGVPREHIAMVCPACGTVQSMTSLLRAGVDQQDVKKYFGFSCVGRWLGSPPACGGMPRPPHTGCDWTLGGFFKIHQLEVLFDGERKGCFAVATPEQAPPAPGSSCHRQVHVGISVRGILHWYPEKAEYMLDTIHRPDGTPFKSVQDLRECLMDELAAGHEVIPLDKTCDNWDWKTGCRGHRIEEPALADA